MRTDTQSRTVISVSGSERRDFLQGLVTNDIDRLSEGLLYSALLSPQGKYLFDFFLFETGQSIMIDVAADRADDLIRQLSFYKLRRPIEIAVTGMEVQSGTGAPPPGAYLDPRCAALGWRRYGSHEETVAGRETEALRVEYCIPQSGIELIPGSTYILEAGFERLNGVDFRKGCFVGQEVTARMKHKGKLNRRLATVMVEGDAQCGDELRAGSRKVGTLFTRSGNKAIAYLRLDRIGEETVTAGEAVVRLIETS